MKHTFEKILEIMQEEPIVVRAKYEHWIAVKDWNCYECSECSHMQASKSNYCPWCGAKMNKETE